MILPQIDIIIPSHRNLSDIQNQINAMESTRTLPGKIISTGLKASASENRNAGLNKSNTEYVIMTDDDLSGFTKGWDSRLYNLLISHPEFSMISPRLMDKYGKFGSMLGSNSQPNISIYAAIGNRIPSACILFRRNFEIFFDEGFIGSGFEDTDFISQNVKKDPTYKVAISNTERITHLNEMKNQKGVYFTHNHAYYINKWGKSP